MFYIHESFRLAQSRPYLHTNFLLDHSYHLAMNSEPRSDVLLERERVTCLLLINTQLMKKAINLYANVLTNQQALQQLPPQNKQSVIELYQNCTRRLHCNLAVLSTVHEKFHSPAGPQPQGNKPQFPVIMSAPPDMPELNQLYTKLQELYPDAVRFLKMKYQQLRKQAQGAASGMNAVSSLGGPMLPMAQTMTPGVQQPSNQQGQASQQPMHSLSQSLGQPPGQSFGQSSQVQAGQGIPSQALQQGQPYQSLQSGLPLGAQSTQTVQTMPMNMSQNSMAGYSPALSHSLQPGMTPSSTGFAKDDYMIPAQTGSGFNPQNMSAYQNMSQEPQLLAMSPQQILQQANTGMDYYN